MKSAIGSQRKRINCNNDCLKHDRSEFIFKK